jgi:hypothetical protein
MRILSAAVLALLTAGCVTRLVPPPSSIPADAEPMPPQELLEPFYQVNRTVHPTHGDTLAELMVQENFHNPRVICSKLDAPPVRVTLSLRKHSSPTGPALALLRVDYEADRPLGPAVGRALQLRLDDATVVPLRFGNPTRATRYGASETTQYVVTPAVLHEIVGAARTSARLSGASGRCDFPISGHARGLIAMFAERELGTAQSARR